MTDTPVRYTNAEIAYVIGMSPATVSRVRRGERGVSVLTLMKFAEAYKLEPNELLKAQRQRLTGDASAWIALLESVLGPASVEPNTTL